MKCLYQPIFGVGQRLQTLPQPVDALPMQGVDRNLFFPISSANQLPGSSLI